jgi:hypothetical protein
MLLDSPGFTKIAFKELVEIDELVTLRQFEKRINQRNPFFHEIGHLQDMQVWGQYASQDRTLTASGDSDDAYAEMPNDRPWPRRWQGNCILLTPAESEAYLAGVPITIQDCFKQVVTDEKKRAVTDAYEREKEDFDARYENRELNTPNIPPIADPEERPIANLKPRTKKNTLQHELIVDKEYYELANGDDGELFTHMAIAVDCLIKVALDGTACDTKECRVRRLTKDAMEEAIDVVCRIEGWPDGENL